MTDFRALCKELLDEVPHESPLTCLARAALAQPEPQTSKKELTDEQLLKCFKIATPCYNMESWRRELDGMRAAIAADRALCAELQVVTELRGSNPASKENLDAQSP